MELNFLIFPCPKSSYREGELRELIKIPVYEGLLKNHNPGPKTRAQFVRMAPLNLREDFPNDKDDSLASVYDDKIDEMPTQRTPKMELDYPTTQIRQSLSPTISQRSSISRKLFHSPPAPPPKHICAREIPCLYLKSPVPTKKMLLYFHANCEDLKSSYPLVDFLRNRLQVNVISIEYPGYGIYNGKPSEDSVLADAEYVYRYTAFFSGTGEENMTIVGRSIGTGAACYLASIFNPSLVVLLSPFLSVQEVVAEKYPLMQKFIKERFNNMGFVQKAKCPFFILHGMQDQAISVAQARQLYGKALSKRRILQEKTKWALQTQRTTQ